MTRATRPSRVAAPRRKLKHASLTVPAVWSVAVLFAGGVLLLAPSSRLLAQQGPPTNSGRAANPGTAGGNWRTADAADVDAARPHSTTFTTGMDVLPNSGGQIWRNYDISGYTRRFPVEAKAERQIVDWILRETGTDLWFGETLGILSATPTKLRVYHTPEVQRVVHDMLDRFTDPAHDQWGLTFRLVTVGNPNWRSRAVPVLQPIELETPGLQAWLISKENAAILLGELRKRVDFTEHLPATEMVQNGQTKKVERRQPVTYARSIRRDNNSGWLLPTADMARFDQGYTLEISPLHDAGGATSEVVIRAAVDQVEKLQTVNIDLPSPLGNLQRVQLQVPQVASWEVHERFRWPADQVLLLSCGVVAVPGPEPNRLLGLPRVLGGGSPRADALLFLENKPAKDRALYTGGLPR